MTKNFVKTDLGIKLMFLDQSEIPVFLDLMRRYSEDEAFSMVIHGYKQLPFSNVLKDEPRP